MEVLKIKILGIGGAGINAVNRLIASEFRGPNFGHSIPIFKVSMPPSLPTN